MKIKLGEANVSKKCFCMQRPARMFLRVSEADRVLGGGDVIQRVLMIRRNKF